MAIDGTGDCRISPRFKSEGTQASRGRRRDQCSDNGAQHSGSPAYLHPLYSDMKVNMQPWADTCMVEKMIWFEARRSLLSSYAGSCSVFIQS